MDIQTLEIVQTANRLVDTLGTRDPHRIARELGIEVVPVDFKRQRGAYKVLMRNRFIFIKKRSASGDGKHRYAPRDRARYSAPKGSCESGRLQRVQYLQYAREPDGI